MLSSLFAANFDQFNTDTLGNDDNCQPSDAFSSVGPDPSVTTSPIPTVDVDPFQTVDPFACQSYIESTATNSDWFQPEEQKDASTTADPFLPQTEPSVSISTIASPKIKKAAPKVQANPKGSNVLSFLNYARMTHLVESTIKQVAVVDPWGTSTVNNNGHDWAQFNDKEASSPFGATAEWPETSAISNGHPSTGKIFVYRHGEHFTDLFSQMSFNIEPYSIMCPNGQMKWAYRLAI
jgi:hypothetical protein